MLLRSRDALILHGSSLRLHVVQAIRLLDERVAVQSYGYRLQEDAERDSWLIRWEFLRRDPSPDHAYPRAHLHFNGVLASTTASQFLKKPESHLHIPTRRVAIESVIWHLIAEWGVQPRSENWRQLLTESIAGWDERRRAE